MATWGEFAEAAPDLAAAGQRLFYQFGVGLGFLATVRNDGGPRLHPMCPMIAGGRIYAFIIPSPKRDDLLRDGRYAMHSFPPKDVDDEFYLSGRAALVSDSVKRAELVAAYHIPVPDDHELFSFDVERALLVTYKHRGDFSPTKRTWRDPNK